MNIMKKANAAKLAVVRGESGVFVHVHVSILLKYCKQR